MTVLLAVHTPTGTAACAAACYQAQGPTCRCICRGVNHGVGITQAAANTARHAHRWLTRHQRRHPDQPGHAQPPLPLYDTA